MSAAAVQFLLELAGAAGTEHHVRVEYAYQRVEVTGSGGREERVDDLALLGEVGIGLRHCSADPAPRAAGELSGRVGGAIDDLSDLGERDSEHVVQHVGDPLGGGQHLEHHEQCEPDGVGHQHLPLGIGLLVDLHDRLGHPAAHIILAARLPGAQHVDAHPANDRGQPRAGVVDRLLLGAA